MARNLSLPGFNRPTTFKSPMYKIWRAAKLLANGNSRVSDEVAYWLNGA